MKNRFSILNFKLFYFLKQIITNEYPDSKSEVKKNKVLVENDLRWEDDGGPAVEVADPTSQAAETQSPQTKNVDGNDLL
jgi:hypothetical protein